MKCINRGPIPEEWKTDNMSSPGSRKTNVFHVGTSYIENIFVIKLISKKRIATNKKTHLLFVDLL